MNVGRLVSFRVEVGCDEADGDVKGFSRDLVPVDEGTELRMDGDKAEWAWTSAELSPVIA